MFWNMAGITTFWGCIATSGVCPHIWGRLIVIIFDISSHCLSQLMHPHLQPQKIFFGFFSSTSNHEKTYQHCKNGESTLENNKDNKMGSALPQKER